MCRRSGELQETRVGASAKASRYHIHRVFQVRSSSSCHQCRFGPGGQSASQAEGGCASIGSTCIETLTVACFIIAAASVDVPGIVALWHSRGSVGIRIRTLQLAPASIYSAKKESSAEMSVLLIMLGRKFLKPGILDGARALGTHRRGTWLERWRGCWRGTCKGGSECGGGKCGMAPAKLSHLQMKVDSVSLFVKDARVKPRLDRPFRSDMGSMCPALVVL
ncbi:uncharacterized protein BDZ83DRAFT_68996 [Colletotrichum acutatum]|uniref:Uncharacterized protein n=1 Tax=Glomerella acutata TaxID=27357 RepID=A0AAD8XKR0_GLOAC|nr:uncharacterized protein BDZ83DRAFT_68996 [Colletotrichum acutatum]KAK1729138.1 hypothetical protein BDZ83DRAFT_68996 [Colletotrichum acutatum]